MRTRCSHGRTRVLDARFEVPPRLHAVANLGEDELPEGASAVGASGDPDAAFALPIIGITGITLVTFLVLLSLPGIIIGIGLLRLRPWSRIAAIVLSILSLAMMPVGTLVGVYGLWVLFNRETERLFTLHAT